MVFGVFDGIHAGHRAFFKQAKYYGDYLIAVVTPDHAVEQLKGRLPVINLHERIDHLKEEDHIDEVVIGDEDLGSWEVVVRYQPDVIALGYDQQLLKEDLEKNLTKLGISPEIKILDAYEPEVYHSSKINKRI